MLTLETWLKTETEEAVRHTRELMFQKSQILFAVVVGQTWFSDLISLDEHTMDLVLGGAQRSCSVEMSEVEIAI
jgi:hypothetical protein